MESDLRQAKAEAESLRQTCARTSATVELLRRQLSEAQQKVGKSQNVAVHELTQLQTEVGQLKKELTEKVRSGGGREGGAHFFTHSFRRTCWLAGRSALMLWRRKELGWLTDW